jgi:hypothetical protein
MATITDVIRELGLERLLMTPPSKEEMSPLFADMAALSANRWRLGTVREVAEKLGVLDRIEDGARVLRLRKAQLDLILAIPVGTVPPHEAFLGEMGVTRWGADWKSRLLDGRGPERIELSPLVKRHNMVDTFLHEVAHAASGIKYGYIIYTEDRTGHGDHWKTAARAMGAAPEQYARND